LNLSITVVLIEVNWSWDSLWIEANTSVSNEDLSIFMYDDDDDDDVKSKKKYRFQQEIFFEAKIKFIKDFFC
jgi:hypothetical protein